MTEEPLTVLLMQWRKGDEDALEKLVPAVYGELRRLASYHMRGERQEHTLQPTAVVNEALLKLIDMEVDWTDRAHFMAVASRQMRRLLVDYARARRRHKRDGGVRVTLDDSVGFEDDGSVDMVDVDNAMNALKELDERKARLVELHYFGGLTYRELAEVTSVSEATVHRELRLAKAWLRRELGQGREPSGG
ncbi:MAG: ECF-type sigma factor [Acidobacteriota bacterium]